MPNPLPTPQVQALLAGAREDLAICTDPTAVHLQEGDGETCTACDQLRGLIALGEEVLAHRERRCGDCAHWEYNDMLNGRLCSLLRYETGPEWFCGDFAPKAP